MAEAHLADLAGEWLLRAVGLQVDENVDDLRPADSALVVLDAGVVEAVVAPHLGQGEALLAAVRADKVL